ncbi:unnamed protein product [Dicrocoelium dendriticum]|nr:unnamed protein product [Dicrocoelium dendriticum]
MVTTEVIAERLPAGTETVEEDTFSIVGEDGRPKERWAPLGANSSPEPSCTYQPDEWGGFDSSNVNYDEFFKLTSENERMNRALMALTTHFAQVQFRIGQVLNADVTRREEMLRSLEEFASRGIPDLPLFSTSPKNQSTTLSDYLCNLQPKPQQLIEELRKQLDELECFAYEIGEQQEPPTQATLEKQRLVLEELGEKLDLDISKLNNLSIEELKSLIDSVVHQFMDPLKLNERLVEQLKTQVIDLERFIDFLHGTDEASEGSTSSRRTLPSRSKNSQERAISLLQRAMAILHIFTSTQFASVTENWLLSTKNRSKNGFCECISGGPVEVNLSDTTHNSATVERAKFQHWGSVRARLEIAIATVLEKVQLFQSFQLEKANRSAAKPTRWSVIPTDSQPSARTLKHSAPRLSSTFSDFVYAGDQVFGTRISLPVQRLHGTPFRPTLSDRQSSVTSSNFSCNPSAHGFASGKHTRMASVQNDLDTDEFLCSEAQRMVVRAVRRHLCPALTELIEHGLLKKPLSTIVEESSGRLQRAGVLLRPIWSCLSTRHQTVLDDYIDPIDSVSEPHVGHNQMAFSGRPSAHSSGMHAWHVLLKYYYMKNGPLYNQSPARRLSESFDLDSYAGKPVTVRQRFFNAMGIVLESHSAYKRSDDAKFKAFVCVALNEGKLASWLRLVFKCQPLVTAIYQPWSYALSTGFDDALQSLKRLTDVEFQLPYDYSVRHLREIRDAF